MNKLLLNSLALFSLTVLAGCGETATEPTGTKSTGTKGSYETPQEAFTALQTAAEQGDFETLTDAMTEDSQQAVAGTLILPLGFIAAFDPDMKTEVEALFEKHGLTDQVDQDKPPEGFEEAGPKEQMRMMGSVFTSPRDFIVEAMTWLDSQGKEQVNGPIEGSLTGVTISGDTAVGTMTIDGEEKPIEFRKQEGSWLVHLPDSYFAQNMTSNGVEVDFTPGEGGVMMGGGNFDNFDFHFDEPDDLPAPGPLSLTEFESAWKISVDVKDQPAIDALLSVTDDAGLSLFDQPDLAETLSQNVTVAAQDVSVVQVIERICEQVNLYPRYKLKTVAFSEGTRPLPAAFAGPFVVIPEVQTAAPYPVGSLTLEFFAAGLPVDAVARLNTLMTWGGNDAKNIRIEPEQIKSEADDLLGDSPGGSAVQCSKSTCGFSRNFQLKNLLRSVTKIPAHEGSISWSMPAQLKTLVIEDPKKDATVSEGDMSFTIRRFNAGGQTSLAVDVTGIDYERVTVAAKDADGNDLSSTYTGGASFGDRQQIDGGFDGNVAKLEFHVTTELEEVKYGFTIPEFAVLGHEKMPEALEKLTMKGDVPATLKYSKIKTDQGQKRIVFECTNTTNKPIYMLGYQVEYLDQNGNVVGDMSNSNVGDRVLIKAGETKQIDAAAFFMPDNAKSGRAKPFSVEFSDGTKWDEP